MIPTPKDKKAVRKLIRKLYGKKVSLKSKTEVQLTKEEGRY
jgi:hypothetical protein